MSWKNLLKTQEKLPKEILEAYAKHTEMSDKIKEGMEKDRQDEPPQKPIPKKESQANSPWGWDEANQAAHRAKQEKAKRQKQTDRTSQLDLSGNVVKAKASHPEGFQLDTWNNLKLNYLSFSNENEMKEIIDEINKEGNFSEVTRLLSRLLRLDDGIQETVLFSSKLPLSLMKERGKALQEALSTVSQQEIEELVNAFLAGNHESLMDYVGREGIPKQTISDRQKKVRTWVQNAEGVREKVEAELEKNPDLKQTAIGKTFGLFEEYGEEASLTTSWENIKDEIAIEYLRFVITSSNIKRAERPKLLPKDKNGQPFKWLIQGGRTREIPAITYILKNEQFDMGDTAFQTSSSDAINRNKAIAHLKRNYTTKTWKKNNKDKVTTDPLQLEFDRLVETQQTGKTVGEGRSDTRGARQATKLITNPKTGKPDKVSVPVEGRARNLNKFFTMLAKPSKAQGQKGYPKLWEELVASMGTNPRYAISTETWENLNEYLELKDLPSETEEEIEEKEDALEEQEDVIEQLLPIGSFTEIDELTGEFDATGKIETPGYLDDNEVAEAIKRMTPSADALTVKPSTLEDVETLKKLFVGSGSARNILSMRFPDRQSRQTMKMRDENGRMYGMLTDGKLDGNLEKPEDVIEVLKIFEKHFDHEKGPEGNLRDVYMDLKSSLTPSKDDDKHEEEWKNAIEKLYAVLESEQYGNLRKAFLDAIKKEIFEESKAVESPAKDWIMDKIG